MRRFTKLLLVPVCALALAACDDSANKQGAAQAGAAGPIEVGVRTLKTEDMPLSVELPGRLNAYQAAEIRPQVNGVILKRMFEEGAIVEEGQQLYQIDPAPYQAAYNTAAAQLQSAQANVKAAAALARRYKDLVRVDAVSKQEYDNAIASADQAAADVAIAQAARDTAQINLNYTKVFSPITGRIGKSAVTPGALVTANQADPLALVQQLDPIYLDITQSSADLMALRRQITAGVVEGTLDSAPVTITFDDSNEVYGETGTLKFSDVTVEQDTGNVQLRALFNNPHNELLPGLFVKASLQQGVLRNALLAPQQSIVRTPIGGTMAWIVDANNKAQMVPVKTGAAVKDKWVITEGLKAGDRVIVEGTIKVQPDMDVKAVDLDAQAEKPAAEGEQQAEAQEEAGAAPSDTSLTAQPEMTADTPTETVDPAQDASAQNAPAAEEAQPAEPILQETGPDKSSDTTSEASPDASEETTTDTDTKSSEQ